MDGRKPRPHCGVCGTFFGLSAGGGCENAQSMDRWTLRHVTVRDLSVALREAGEGIPVLLVHGNASSSVWWEPTLQRVPLAWRWLAPDLRGRGETSGPCAGWTIPQLAQDLEALLDVLAVQSAHVVGHSLGASVALELALRRPTRVLSLCLLNPGWFQGDMPEALGDASRLHALANNPGMLRMLLRAVAPGVPEGPEWERLVQASLLQKPEATVEGGRAYQTWSVADDLATLKMPVTVLRGAGDALSTAALCTALVERVQGARLAEIPGAGHSPNVERPDLFVAALLEHLQKS